MGEQAREKNLAMQKEYLPTSLFMGGNAENIPLLEYKLVPSVTRIYVCRNRVCNLPVDEVIEALGQINSWK